MITINSYCHDISQHSLTQQSHKYHGGHHRVKNDR